MKSTAKNKDQLGIYLVLNQVSACNETKLSVLVVNSNDEFVPIKEARSCRLVEVT